jgi:two-component system response regulator DevR
MIKVFLLDDHEIVRRGVRDLLEAAGDLEVVGEAGTAAEAIARVPATQPDVAVLDVRLPDGSGIEVCRELRAANPELRCLMLTSFSARVIERLRNPAPQDERLAGLSPQERRILTLLADGMTNRQIAEQLYLAEKTVKNYVSNLLMKLGMHRRTEAAVFAARLADRQRREP